VREDASPRVDVPRHEAVRDERDVFHVDSTFGACEEHDAAAALVERHRQVELGGDVDPFLDQDFLHDVTLEGRPEQLVGDVRGVVRRRRLPHGAGLRPPVGGDVRLDDGSAAESSGGVGGFARRGSRTPRRRDHAVRPQKGLAVRFEDSRHPPSPPATGMHSFAA
jgi:hypothetical protein